MKFLIVKHCETLWHNYHNQLIAFLNKNYITAKDVFLKKKTKLANESKVALNYYIYLQVCEECDPQRVYWRLFDVTENTGLRRHCTGRTCHGCNGKLSDTIVHFGEKRELSFPQNWKAAFEHAKKADMILCLGSSLKVSRFETSSCLLRCLIW